MNFDEIVEAAIKEAMKRGEFDNLAGKGKPIDLTEYFDTPEDVRVAQSLLKNAGMVPVEIELLQEIATLKEKLSVTSDKVAQQKIRKAIEEKRLQFVVSVERQKRSRK